MHYLLGEAPITFIQQFLGHEKLATTGIYTCMHFLTFGLLALLISVGFYDGSRGSIPFAKVTVLAVGYGLLIEVYQWLLPWRAFGLNDLVWNTVGVLFFVALLRWQLSQRVP